MAVKKTVKKASAPKRKVVKTVKRARKATPRKKKRTFGSLLISLLFAGLAFVAWKKGYRRLCFFFVGVSAAFGVTWALDLQAAEAYMQLGAIVVFFATAAATAVFSLINLLRPDWGLRIATTLNLK